MALASPLAWGRLSPGLGSSRLGDAVDEGLEAPLLVLGLGVVGLTRARLARASRVPSGSTMMFMATEQKGRFLSQIYTQIHFNKYQYHSENCAAVNLRANHVEHQFRACTGEREDCVSVSSPTTLIKDMF